MELTIELSIKDRHIKELKETLGPFASMYTENSPYSDNYTVLQRLGTNFKKVKLKEGDFRKAHNILNKYVDNNTYIYDRDGNILYVGDYLYSTQVPGKPLVKIVEIVNNTLICMWLSDYRTFKLKKDFLLSPSCYWRKYNK